MKEITKKVITFYLETKYKYKKGKRETRKIFSVFFLIFIFYRGR